VPAVLVSSDDVQAGKPHPEGFLLAAEALGLSPSSCVVVEDSPAGVAAGKAAGATVVAITTTHAAADLAEADIVVTALSELPGAVS
jgi:sugar-phosphatase